MNLPTSRRYFILTCIAFILVTIFVFMIYSNTPVTLVNVMTRQDSKSINRINKKAERNYVLSYSLFGKNSWRLYGENVVSVAKEALDSRFYNNWTVRIYHDNFPTDLQANLTSLFPNLKFYDTTRMPTFNLSLTGARIDKVAQKNGMTWRFLPMGDTTVDVMCSRDLDSPLYQREEDAVKEWLQSGKIMHVMRDRPVHGVYILGGLWCFKNIKNRKKGQIILKKLFDNAQNRSPSKEAAKGDDQNILSSHMWPLVRDDVMQHDSYLCKQYPGSIPFPSKRTEGYFTGCVRPCGGKPLECPVACRPTKHQDWIYC